jgi:hypothetical protein
MEIIKILNKSEIFNSLLDEKQRKNIKNCIINLKKKDIQNIFYNIQKKVLKNIILSNKLLNLNGLYVCRTIFAENYVRSKIPNYENNPYLKSYMEKGYVVINNFLEEKDFYNLQKNVFSLINNTSLHTKGKGAGLGVTKIFKKHFSKQLLDFYNNKKLLDLLCFCSFIYDKKVIKDNNRQYIEILEHIEESRDIQKIWHVDTFHYTCKWWFYIEDIIDEEKGPLEYIEGSHLNTLKKVEYEHNLLNDLLNKKKKCVPSLEGSFRYFDKNTINNLGYPDKAFKKMLFKKNTLIITNNRGIHRRGLGKVGEKRKSLSASLRFNILN